MKKGSKWEKIKAYLAINRFEFTPVSEGIIISFMVLGAATWKELVTWPVLLTFLTYNVATYWGGAINVYFDYEFDRKSPTKKRLPAAIDLVGKKKVRNMLVAEAVLFLAMGGVLAYITGKFILLLLLLAGTFFTIAYSVEPLRFKKRGFLNSLSLFLIIMFLPPLFGWYTVRETMQAPAFLMILGLALVQYGNGLYYTTADYTEDKNDNIRTPSVLMGVIRSVRVSMLLVLAGFLCLLAGYSHYGNAIGLVVIAAGQAFSFYGMAVLLYAAHKDDAEMERIIKKNEMIIPAWVAVSAFSVLIACLLRGWVSVW